MGYTKPVTFPYTVTADAILYAKWVQTAFITDITLSKGTLSPIFNPDTLKYTVALDEYTAGLSISEEFPQGVRQVFLVVLDG